MPKKVSKEEVVVEIAGLIGAVAPKMSTGSTEPRDIFDAVNLALGLGLAPGLTKPGAGQRHRDLRRIHLEPGHGVNWRDSDTVRTPSGSRRRAPVCHLIAMAASNRSQLPPSSRGSMARTQSGRVVRLSGGGMSRTQSRHQLRRQT